MAESFFQLVAFSHAQKAHMLAAHIAQAQMVQTSRHVSYAGRQGDQYIENMSYKSLRAIKFK